METTLRIQNDEGLHARPAAALVKEANNFKSDINLVYGDKTVNAKSIMGLMTLGLTKDAEFTLQASGEDESQAIESLTNLVNEKFNLH